MVVVDGGNFSDFCFLTFEPRMGVVELEVVRAATGDAVDEPEVKLWR